MIDLAPVTVPFRSGQLNIYPKDDPIGRSILEYGEWAGLELDFLRHIVRSGDTVVDVGANVGTHAIEFAKWLGADGTVLAIEPQPDIFRLLSKNISINDLARNVVLHNAAAGAESGTVKMVVASDEHANFGAARVSDKGSIEVQSITIDGFHLNSCRLIKVDSEGCSGAVLKGAAATIATHRPFLFLECNDVNDAVDIYRAECLHSYHFWFVCCPAYNPRNFLANPYNTFGFASETAVIAVPIETDFLMPSVNGVVLDHISDLDQLVGLVLSSPRFGDKTPFDRVLIRRDLDRLAEELERAKYRELNLLRQLEILGRPIVPPTSYLLLGRLRRSKLWPWIRPIAVKVRRIIES
jgi:FkbM family methyltransferase